MGILRSLGGVGGYPYTRGQHPGGFAADLADSVDHFDLVCDPGVQVISPRRFCQPIFRESIMNRKICLLTAIMILLSGEIRVGFGMSDLKQATPGKTESAALGTKFITKEARSADSNNPLAGTEWRLLEIQYMNDTTIRPEDPSLFTMRLNMDGTVNMRLDCNRAQGTWFAEPGADGVSGRFEFGPLAATRALCPPPNLDERIVAQAKFVRGYLLRGGRLYLSLMADGGIYAWEPLATRVPFETKPDAELEATILRASPDYNRKSVEIGGGEARYLYSRVDLNGDGREEVFAYLLGSIFCGTGGCNLLVFTVGEGGYAMVNNFPISRLPVIVSIERTAGWKNLLRLEYGGGAKPSYVRHTFDGERYVEQDRLPADTSPEGTEVLAGEFTFQDGIPLKPHN
jgi:heat shock protein HslJ